MGVFKWIYEHSLLGRTVTVISDRIIYKKDKKILSDTLYGPAFNLVLKKYLKANFKKDWIGRLYGVVNPNLDENGKYDFNNVIIEMDGDNTNNNEYVRNWVHRQLRLIEVLFKLENLYDYIGIELKHVGPPQLDNYLVIIDIVSRKIWVESLKKFFRHLLFDGALAGIIMLVLNLLANI